MAGRVAGNDVQAGVIRVPGSQVWKVGAVAALATAAVNIVILLAAKAAGVEFFVPDMQGRVVEVGIGQVGLMSVFPLLLGTAAAALAARFSVSLRWVQGAAVVLTLLSFISPLALDSPVSTKLVLSAMHVVAGIAFVAGVERVNQAAGSYPH
jgi:hypothetical protein